jgi:biopolymer transport protein ExbD
MKLGKHKLSDVKVDMTPMIDIVFQLLVFFIMTFKVVAMEGDFKIKMPIASNEAQSMEEVFPTVLNVKISAGANGGVTSVAVDTGGADPQSFSDENWPASLTSYVAKAISGEGDPSTAQDTEVEFDIDYGLRYMFTIKAIESVSGIIQPDGSVKKLIEKIKFKNKKGA